MAKSVGARFGHQVDTTAAMEHSSAQQVDGVAAQHPFWQQMAARSVVVTQQDSSEKAAWLDAVSKKVEPQRPQAQERMARDFVDLPNEARVSYVTDGEKNISRVFEQPGWLDSVPSVTLRVTGSAKPLNLVFANALTGGTNGTLFFNEELMGKALLQEANLRSTAPGLTTAVGLGPGNIAYSVPANMSVGETYFVEVRIIKGESDTLLLLGVDADGYVVEAIRIGDIAEAHLVDPTGGDNFTITPTAAKELGVDAAEPAVWQWGVTPRHGGSLSLVLSVSTRPKDGPTKNIKVFERTVSVKAGLIYVVVGFIKANWQWLWTVVLAPIAVFFRKRIIELFRKPAGPAAPGR